MACAKSETEIITISTQTSDLFHMTPMKVSLMFHFLIWTSAGISNMFRVLRYILCLIGLNIAAVTNNCL